MSTFYMTYGRVRPNQIPDWVEANDVPLLTNAQNRWSFNTDRWLSMWEYDTEHVIDAGGYNVQSKYVDQGGNITDDPSETLAQPAPFYPWSVESYHEWLEDHVDEIEWATVMDYACEERFDELWSLQDRIDATIDNTIEQWDMDRSYQLLPVLQGRSIEDYVYSAEQLEAAGIPLDYVGIGTVCRLSSETRIVELEKEIRERTNVGEIHGFGVKVNAYKLGAKFDTADSQAWVYEAARGKIRCIERTDDGGLRMYTRQMRNDSLTRTVHSFKVYYAYVTYLMEGEAAVDVDELIEQQQHFDYTDERPDDSHVRGQGSVALRDDS